MPKSRARLLLANFILSSWGLPAYCQTKTAPSEADREIALGKRMASIIERTSKVVDDPRTLDYLNRLAARIADSSSVSVPVTIRVIDSDEINALTLPGGFQLVNKGLVSQAESEAELAAALSHGIAHSALNAQTQNAEVRKLLAISMFHLVLISDSLLPNGWDRYTLCSSFESPFNYYKFRRDTEVAADRLSIRLLYQAGYDPEALPHFLERAWPQTPGPSKSVSTKFSVYPPLLDRLRAMREEIERESAPHDVAVVSSSEFEAIQERVRHLDDPDPATPRPHLRIIFDETVPTSQEHAQVPKAQP